MAGAHPLSRMFKFDLWLRSVHYHQFSNWIYVLDLMIMMMTLTIMLMIMMIEDDDRKTDAFICVHSFCVSFQFEFRYHLFYFMLNYFGTNVRQR